jgi:hypothetical protein
MSVLIGKKMVSGKLFALYKKQTDFRKPDIPGSEKFLKIF